MNKKTSRLHVLVFLACSCYICKNFAMESDREKVSALEKRYHLALDLAEPERVLPNLAKSSGSFVKAYEGTTQAIAELREIQARCVEDKDVAFTKTVSNLLSNLTLLNYIIAQQDEFKVECAVAGERKERMSAFDKLSSEVFGGFSSLETRGKTELARMSEAHERFAAALAALTSRVDTHDKFATDLASLTSKVGAHDNLAGTLASLKSEVDGLSGSVSSRFADSETREKTELARMSQAHDQVAKALAALTGKVDDIHSCVSTRLSTIDSRLMESEKLGKALDASLTEFKGRANPLLDDFARRMGLVENLASATNVAYYEFKDKKLNPLLDDLARRLNAMDTRMGTFASQTDLDATRVSLNTVESRRMEMEPRLSAVEGLLSRVSRIESWFDPTDLRMGEKNNVPVRFSALESRLEITQAEVSALNKRTLDHPPRLVALESRLTGFASQASLAALDARLKAVEGISSKSSSLESRLAALEADHRLLVAAHKFCPCHPTSATPIPSFYHH